MVTLQVNARPAENVRHHNRTQRSERADETRITATPQLQTTYKSATPSTRRHYNGSNGRDHQIAVPSDPVALAALLRQQMVWKLIPGTTIGRALVSATDRLRGAKITTDSLDAQIMLASVLGVDRSWLFAHHEYELTEKQAATYSNLIVRRTQDEPIAYLIGKKEFYGLELAVDQRVLIPRPETELLVDQVLRFVQLYGERTVRIADIGTGSGAIALALATNTSDSLIYAVDISQEALALAEENVARHDKQGHIRLLCGDLLLPLYEQVDIIVANLPYINHRDYVSLDRSVREFEPQVALEAGDDGLDAIRGLLQDAPRYLSPDGIIFLEIAYDQGQAVLDLVDELIPQASDVELRQDLSGHDRIVTIIM